MTCGIYKITSPSGNFYIGSSSDIERRWREHRSMLRRERHANPALQSAYKKYGLDKLGFEIIEICEVTRNLEREQFYIDTLSPAYNIGPVAGQEMLGRTHTEEAKAAMSLSRRVENLSEETRKRMRDGHVGRIVSEETRKKLSQSLSGSRNPCFGKVYSPEEKMMRSMALKDRPKPDAMREKIRLARTGKPRSAETVEKMRAAHRKYSDEDYLRILELSNAGMTQKEISKLYHVDRASISNYIKRAKALTAIVQSV
jgi:group I intron endonuclease